MCVISGVCGAESYSINIRLDMATSNYIRDGWLDAESHGPRDNFEVTSVDRLVRGLFGRWSVYGQTSFLKQRRPLPDLLRDKGLGLLPGRETLI